MDKVNTKSLIERMRDHLSCYWKEGDVAPQLTSIELMLIGEAADELAALKEQYRVLEDELLVLGDERNESVAALKFAAKLLSREDPYFSEMNETEMVAYLIRMPKEMK